MADIEAAAVRIGRDVHHTPLLSSRSLTDACGAQEVRAKGEHLQRGGSFKVRGALNAVRQIPAARRAAGVVAFSSGNHAQGVALAARIEGIPATIVMPHDAPAVKISATKGYGATVVLYDRFREDREEVAAEIQRQRGATMVPPFNDPHVMAGQGTIGLEVMADWSDVEVVVIPIGGGGLAAGMAIAMTAINPEIELWGVEPEIADDARQSLEKGEIVRIGPPHTVADGVATTALGTLTFPVLRRFFRGIVTVSETEILDATVFVLERMKQVVEPTGALTTAALLRGKIDVTNRKVLTMFCGGNLDLDVLNKRRVRS